MTSKKIILLGFIAAFYAGCTPEQAVVEGKADYYPITAAIGGEADPAGFILSDAQWISGKPDASNSRIYLIGQVDSSYLQKRIQVTGAARTVSAGGVETPRRIFPEVQVERVKVLP